MYEVWTIDQGTTSLIDLQRDSEVAKQRALEHSRLDNAVYYVARQGFGTPLYFVLHGVISDPAEVMRRWSSPIQPPTLRLEPAAPEVAGVEFSASDATADDVVVDDAPRPRRTKRGPSEVKSKPAAPSEVKQFDATITGVEDEGIVSAFVNIFGIIDDGLDIVHSGAFTKTLAENGHRVRVLDSHNNRSALNVVGRPLEIREVGRDELPPQVLMRHPEATGGLFTRTQFLLNTPEGKGIFERIKAGALNEYSIGFDALDTDMTKTLDQRSGREVVVRNIRTARLWEYSVCTFGMNDQTTTVDVKAADVPAEVTSPTPEPVEHKVGRVLSARNFQSLQQAAELLNAVLSSAGLNDGDEPGSDPEKSQHDDHEHKQPDGPQDAPETPTSREEAGPLSEQNAPAVSPMELQTKIAQFLTDMEG